MFVNRFKILSIVYLNDYRSADSKNMLLCIVLSRSIKRALAAGHRPQQNSMTPYNLMWHFIDFRFSFIFNLIKQSSRDELFV